jgi:hypothetical protein
MAVAGSGVASAAALSVARTQLISASPSGEPSNNIAKGSFQSVMSSNGRFVAFASASSNIIPGVTPPSRETFLYDRTLHTMEIVSRTSATDELANSSNQIAGVSDDGRYVVFGSAAQNLADENNVSGGIDHLYMRDRQAGTTTLISSPQLQYSVMVMQGHSISRDGNIIVYSAMTHYGTGGSDQSTTSDYVYNRTTHTTTQLPNGAHLPIYDGGGNTTVSGNGRYVTYAVPGTPPEPNFPAAATTYRYDLTTGTSLPIDTDANRGAVLDNSGTHALYYKIDPPVAPYTGRGDLYLKDLTTGTSQILVTDVQDNGGYVDSSLSISDDANRVTYAGATDGVRQTTVREISTDTSIALTDSPAFSAAISADGLAVAYDATLDQPNSRFQVYVAQLAADAPLLALSGPAPNSTVSGTVTLHSNVISSLNYSHIFYVFNSSSQIVASHYQYNVPASTTDLTFDWDTTTVPNGTYKVYASSKDSANHKEAYSTDYYYVTVAN